MAIPGEGKPRTGQATHVTGRCDLLVHFRPREEVASNPGKVEGEGGKASRCRASLGPIRLEQDTPGVHAIKETLTMGMSIARLT